MEKIRFRAKQISTGIIGAVMFQAQDLVKELGTYLKEEHKYEASKKEQDPTYELEFDVQVQRWYKRRKRLFYAVSAINGHTRGKCETPGCLLWIE